MKKDRTFTMIKPDAVKNQYIGAILDRIVSSGFKIIALKKILLSKQDVERFYEVHKDKPFFEELVTFMSSGPIVAAILQKENAVEDFRALIGATNPDDATEGTIRKLYATSVEENAIHGSDSNENAEIESNFHFSGREIF